jgi:transposase-like protein
MATDAADTGPMPLDCFACPNAACELFNRFGAGNLSVCELMGKGKAIRRLYCNHCGQRFSERRGSLMQDAKLPVVRVVKCLTHGCSMEATADICEVDQRTVARLLDRAGPRAEEFHRQALQRLERPPAAVEMDELHGRVASPPPTPAAGKKGGPRPATPTSPPTRSTAPGPTPSRTPATPRPTTTPTPRPGVVAAAVAAVARWVTTGSTRRWTASRAS